MHTEQPDLLVAMTGDVQPSWTTQPSLPWSRLQRVSRETHRVLRPEAEREKRGEQKKKVPGWDTVGSSAPIGLYKAGPVLIPGVLLSLYVWIGFVAFKPPFK